MVERSRPWDGIVTGDPGPYSDDQWTDVWFTLLGPAIASEGVFRGQPLGAPATNELNLAGAVSPLTISPGRALVDGSWYDSDANFSQVVASPAVNPRIDRIVLRKDWVLQTIRLTKIDGAEAAGPVPPALTQVDGTTWDLPLWQIFITTGGAITHFRDERQFLGQYEPAGYSTLRQWYEQDDFGWPNTLFDNTNDGDSVKGWTISISAGAGNEIEVDTTAGRSKGFVTLRHGAGTADVVRLNQAEYRPDQGNARFFLIAKEPNTNANLDRVIGLTDGGGTLTPANGVYFRNDASADGNWHAITRAGAVETDTDTLIALSNSFKTLEIQWRSNASVTFLIDGAVVTTHTTNIPNNVSLNVDLDIFDNAVAPVSQAYQDIDLYRFRGDR